MTLGWVVVGKRRHAGQLGELFPAAISRDYDALPSTKIGRGVMISLIIYSPHCLMIAHAPFDSIPPGCTVISGDYKTRCWPAHVWRSCWCIHSRNVFFVIFVVMGTTSTHSHIYGGSSDSMVHVLRWGLYDTLQYNVYGVCSDLFIGISLPARRRTRAFFSYHTAVEQWNQVHNIAHDPSEIRCAATYVNVISKYCVIYYRHHNKMHCVCVWRVTNTAK
jgi:hypothetical protein